MRQPDLYLVELRLVPDPCGFTTEEEAFAALERIVGRDFDPGRVVMDANQLCSLMLARKKPRSFPGPTAILEDRPLDRWEIAGWRLLPSEGGGPSQKLADWVVAVTEGTCRDR